MNARTYTRTMRTPAETRQLAATLAPLLEPGDVVMLEGDLGAGKTHFVQGVAAGLGIEGDVTSPTFNILITYTDGSLELNHFDLYRLDSADQLEDVGYWDVLEGGGVSFVEWGDKFPDDLPSDFLCLHFSVGDDGARTVEVRACGERAHDLLCVWGSVEAAHLIETDIL